MGQGQLAGGVQPVSAPDTAWSSISSRMLNRRNASLSVVTARAAWLHDQGLPAGEAANMAKYAAAEAALGAIDAAIQTHGGNGLSVEYGLIPLWGLTRVLRIAPVNREMILNYIATHTLALPKSY
jgi:alkylation response protein AidB-like acyl-CoA dehydrogenase